MISIPNPINQLHIETNAPCSRRAARKALVPAGGADVASISWHFTSCSSRSIPLRPFPILASYWHHPPGSEPPNGPATSS